MAGVSAAETPRAQRIPGVRTLREAICIIHKLRLAHSHVTCRSLKSGRVTPLYHLSSQHLVFCIGASPLWFADAGANNCAMRNSENRGNLHMTLDGLQFLVRRQVRFTRSATCLPVRRSAGSNYKQAKGIDRVCGVIVDVTIQVEMLKSLPLYPTGSLLTNRPNSG